MAAAIPWSRRTRRSAPHAACRSTTPSIRETHHPVPPEPRFAADLGFLGNRLPDREARVDEFFLHAARARRATASCSAAAAGATSRCRPTSPMWATSTPATTTRSTARRAPCSTSAARAWRATASRRRRGCSRRPAPAPASSPTRGTASSSSSSRNARCCWPRTARRWRRTCGRSIRSARGDRRARHRRVLAEHTYAHRAAQVEALLDRRQDDGSGDGRRHEPPAHRHARALDHLVLGQRPRHHLSRPGARACARAATTCCSWSATCRGTPAIATCRIRLMAAPRSTAARTTSKRGFHRTCARRIW